MLTFDSTTGHFLQNGMPIDLSPQEMKEMEELEWWHSIPFAPGKRPSARCNPVEYIPLYFLDKVDFKGKSYLDIGCWDGFQCYYAEAMGATRVVGVDDLSQRNMGPLARTFAKEKLQSRVEFIDLNVYDLSPKFIGSFDIVSMFGVLYHLVHPMLGIEKAASVCRETFLLSSHYVPGGEDIPLCVLYPHDELAGDSSNWTGPNKTWVMEAIRIQGFEPKFDQTYHGDRISVLSERIENKHSRNKLLNAHRDAALMKKKDGS